MNFNKDRLCDLFCENFGFSEPVSASNPVLRKIGAFDMTEGTVSKDGGTYSTVLTGTIWKRGTSLFTECSKALVEIIISHASRVCEKKPEKIVVAALGNPFVTADSLGVRCADKVTATGSDSDLSELGYPEVYVIKAGVKAQSGLDSSELISLVTRRVGADIVIAVDSLAAKSAERICTLMQISDAGIVPGSGASYHSKAIDKSSAGCPVITLGIPTVIRKSIANMNNESSVIDSIPVLYTRADVESAVNCYSSILASAINSFFSGWCHK